MKVAFRAIFVQPQHELNPSAFRMKAPASVEIIEEKKGRWIAREPRQRRQYRTVPAEFSTATAARKHLESRFEECIEQWQPWTYVGGEPRPATAEDIKAYFGDGAAAAMNGMETPQPAAQAPAKKKAKTPEAQADMFDKSAGAAVEVKRADSTTPAAATDAKLIHCTLVTAEDKIKSVDKTVLSVCGLKIPKGKSVPIDWVKRDYGPKLSCVACQIEAGRILSERAE